MICLHYTACDCNSVGALDNLCDVSTGQCKCRTQTYGRECDQCEPGSWNYPNCQRCMCHGHTDECDSRTGMCLNCQGFTEGTNCDRCVLYIICFNYLLTILLF